MGTQVNKEKVFHVDVDFEACKDCGYCIEVCPREVFAPADSFNVKGYRPVCVKYSEKCIGCRRCFFACPDFAIEVKERPTGGERHEKNI